MKKLMMALVVLLPFVILAQGNVSVKIGQVTVMTAPADNDELDPATGKKIIRNTFVDNNGVQRLGRPTRADVAKTQGTSPIMLSFPVEVDVVGDRARPILLTVWVCVENKDGVRQWTYRSRPEGVKNVATTQSDAPEMNAAAIRQKTTATVKLLNVRGKVVAWKIIAGSSVDKKPIAKSEWKDEKAKGEFPKIPSRDDTGLI